MKPEWKEGQDRSITLADDEPSTFSLYLQLLYGNCMAIGTSEEDKDLPTDNQYETLAKINVLAERLLDRDTKNIIIDTMLSKSQTIIGEHSECVFPGLEEICVIYEGTPPFSPARRLMTDLWVQSGEQSWLTGTSAEAPRDFL